MRNLTALLDKAKQAFNRGDHAVALKALARLMEREKRNADARILTAMVHEKLGDRAAAGLYLAGAIDLASARRRDVAFRAASHFLAVNDNQSALAALLKLHAHMASDSDVNHSICSLYREAGRYAEALPFARHLADHGSSAGNFLNAGIVLSGLGHYEEAYPALLKAYAANPTERLALSELFWCAANLCDFSLSATLQSELEAAYAREGDQADIRENAFRALTWSGDEAYHALCARRTAQVLLPQLSPHRPQPRKRTPEEPLRIGYVSADFCEHATMALFAGVLEAHDRDRFQIYGICHTPQQARTGNHRARFLASVDHYIDILDLDDQAAAELIRTLELDILVDLKGFTQSSRLGIFSRRPAPVAITYLGFPGSVPGAGIDYALTDAVVTPAASELHYEERLLRLDPCYQSNDDRRPPVARTGNRAAHGLPKDAIVFCSFNQTQKIRGPVFAAWMQILSAVDGSVLWLLDHQGLARTNLEKAASDAGVDPNRLIFAPKMPMTDHLARLAEADIALDTAPYNGHTTTSDALWCGVPVLTWHGSSFASRVSESLLRAVGLPELVATDIQEFVRLAVELAQDKDRHIRLRQTLLEARKSAALFDTKALTRQIEAHYEAVTREPVDA